MRRSMEAPIYLLQVKTYHYKSQIEQDKHLPQQTLLPNTYLKAMW